VQAALGSFLALAPAQRGCVILKDVLDHSLEEIAAELELSVPAVKAALHRGRAALRRSARAPPAPPSAARATSAALRRYASLFNAHDWDGVRGLLAEDVRLDLVSRTQGGRAARGRHVLRQLRARGGWQLQPGWFEAARCWRCGSPPMRAPRYFIELGWRDGEVVSIRDFRYVALHRPGGRVRARRRLSGKSFRPAARRPTCGSRSARRRHGRGTRG
jgi:RNA polymerase sigma-70 factor (ECF subfamily)